jgi:cell division protein FtsL
MARLNLVLLLAVLASALYLVHTQYESRRLYVELEKASAQHRFLETDSERLQVERRAQATPLKVEKLARDRLQMRTATPAITQYVSYQPGAAAPAARTNQPKQTRPAGGAQHE